MEASCTPIKDIFGNESVLTTYSKKYFLAIHGVPCNLSSNEIIDDLRRNYQSINSISLKYSDRKTRTIVVGFTNKNE